MKIAAACNLLFLAAFLPATASAQALQDAALVAAPAVAASGLTPTPLNPVPAPSHPLSQTVSLSPGRWLPSPLQNDQTANEYPRQGLRLNLDAIFSAMDRPEPTNPDFESLDSAGIEGVATPSFERYHWKGLLWESFAFFGVENSQRLFADQNFRRLTAEKPFWHDYFASLKEWNWRRWNDGDDFLVAYIAHPMQGSVTSFIEIQNSPKQRDLRITDGSAYWKSRLGPALLWSTLYSTDQKLGPLGEAALGSEGGENYVLHCPYYCYAYFANPSQFKVTNNTGWVKLVTTPVIGTLWTVMEDALDHFVSDRVQGDDLDRVFPKILRGSLNPARTMANALRWRKPWYRDWQHGTENLRLTSQPHFLPGDDDIILAAPRYEFFPHVDWISLPVNTVTCSPCRRNLTGYGFGFSSRLATYADLDSDVNYISNASPLPSDRAGGNILMGTFGLRSGYTSKFFSLKAYLRPGFLSYDRAYQSSPSSTNPTPTLGRITHFTTAIGLDADYVINRRLAIRGVIGNQPVRYREPYVDPPGPGSYPYLSWLSKLYFSTSGNWTSQAGAVLRF